MTRPPDATRLRMRIPGLALALAALLAACAGGSGSSGFGAAARAENAAIESALATLGCTTVTGADGLTVCAADGVGAAPIGTPGPTPGPGSQNATVDTNIDATRDIACVAIPASDQCTIRMSFATNGFPAGTAFRVAVRERDPDGHWRLAAAPDENGTPNAPSFDVDVVLDGPAVDAGGAAVQMAVLVFLLPPGPLPVEVDTLGATGADFAFVTSPVTPSP